jgi:2-methylcitrate dehydratase PrpD
VRELGEFVACFDWRAHSGLLEPLVRVLLDTLGVTVAGARTVEMRALTAAWGPEPGRAQLFGVGKRAVPEVAAYLNGVSAVVLELDEGNKYARGHPASHAFPAALAVAQVRDASGPELAAALLVGHEVASRFGRATRLSPGIHPHGNWGTTGAAAAVARLMGLDGAGVAAALDVACGTVLATPFETALAGSAARNGWVGAANFAGISAARTASAGLARVEGSPRWTLGGILGAFDPGELTADLGQRFDVEKGYFKRHASCSYTHPPGDAVLDILRHDPDLDTGRITAILVETHRTAANLNRTAVPTRLAAMFSIPYVVAAVLTTVGCSPAAFDDAHRADPEVRRLAELTRVVSTEEFDRRLPEERAARVTLTLDDGSVLAAEVPNPVGDIAHHPFGLPEIREKLGALLGPAFDIEALESLIRELLECEGVDRVLRCAP